MADRNMFKAQFQLEHKSLVPDRTTHANGRPLTASEACSVLDQLKGDIGSRISDREIRNKAAQTIDDVKSRIRSNASYGISGHGFGQSHTSLSKDFTVDRNTYRIDIELSGDIKG